MTFGIDVFGATSYTTLQADTLVVSNHWSNKAGKITNHPQGNPPSNTDVNPRPPEDPRTYLIYEKNNRIVYAPFYDLSTGPSKNEAYSQVASDIDTVKSFIAGRGDYYIDTITDPSTISTTSGRSTSTKSKKSKSTKPKKSVWKRLRKRFKW